MKEEGRRGEEKKERVEEIREGGEKGGETDTSKRLPALVQCVLILTEQSRDSFCACLGIEVSTPVLHET